MNEACTSKNSFKPLRAAAMAILFVFVLLIQPAVAQNYYFKHYQVENGISNNNIRAILQDKTGFLWIGTRDGLNRFDGYSFKVFRTDETVPGSIGNSFIRCLVLDINNDILVGTRSGIYRYHQKDETFELIPGSKGQTIKELLLDNDHNIWYIGTNKAHRYNIKDGTTINFDLQQPPISNSLCKTPDGAIWVSTIDGLLKRYNQQTNSFTSFNLFSHSSKALSNNIEKIHSLGTHEILVGTRNQGVKIFDTRTSTYKDLLNNDESGSNLLVRDFMEYSPNEVWIGTESGIFIYNRKTNALVSLKKNYTNPFSLSDNVVYTMYKDRENNVWVGTYFGGLNYYSEQNNLFEKYFKGNAERSISGHAIRQIEKDAYGNIWAATEDGGLNKINAGSKKIDYFTTASNKGNISSNNIHTLLANGKELWIGTFNDGIEVMDISSGKIMRHYNKGEDSFSLKSNLINTLYRTRSGEILVGTNTGLYRYEAATDHFKPIPQLSGYIICALEDVHGTIWTGTQLSGIDYYNPKTGEAGSLVYDERNNKSLSNNSVNSFFEDSKKRLWIGTDGGGLCRYNGDKTFTRITTRDGLPSNFIFSLLEDDQKRLWITTSQGLVRYNAENGNIATYTTADGLLTNQFNYSSSFKDSDGKMYFGSVKGLVSFYPNNFTRPTFNPPLVITGLQVNNKELTIDKNHSPLSTATPFTKEITLQHDQSTISIDFAALSFVSPEKTHYAYKLDGLDKEYTYLNTNRKVYYTNLSPGYYTFRVKAFINNQQNNPETLLRIHILPPLWASNLAYLIYTIIALTLIYFAVKNYHRRLEEKKEKEIYEAKIEFFTNVSHEIKSPLTLIKGPLENLLESAADEPDMKEDLLMMEKSTNRLIDLTNQLLDFRGVETKGFTINFEKNNITEIVKECYATYATAASKQKKSFTITCPVEPVIAFVDADAFYKIISNLFSNALKYCEHEVDVKLVSRTNNGSNFVLEVRSDGATIPSEMREKIFEPFVRLKTTQNKQGTGIGLALARSLAELHKGKLYLKDDDHAGNIFVLSLPIEQHASESRKKFTLLK